MKYFKIEFVDLIGSFFIGICLSALFSLSYAQFFYGDYSHNNEIKREKHRRCWANGWAKVRGEKPPHVIFWSCKLGDL